MLSSGSGAHRARSHPIPRTSSSATLGVIVQQPHLGASHPWKVSCTIAHATLVNTTAKLEPCRCMCAACSTVGLALRTYTCTPTNSSGLACVLEHDQVNTGQARYLINAVSVAYTYESVCRHNFRDATCTRVLRHSTKTFATVRCN